MAISEEALLVRAAVSVRIDAGQPEQIEALGKVIDAQK